MADIGHAAPEKSASLDAPRVAFTPAPHAKGVGCAACLLRVYWAGLGNAVLIFSAIHIILRSPGNVFYAADWVYLAGVPPLLAARYLDIACCGGQTLDNAPATMAHWSRYAVLLLLVSAGALLAAHGIAYGVTHLWH